MRFSIKRVYISVLVLVFVMLTCVATTYAWVGILTYSTFEEFELNVNASNLKEYGIELSLDGVNFGTEISSIDLQKQILINSGCPENELTSEEMIEKKFSVFNLSQCTNNPDFQNNKLSTFKNLSNVEVKSYFKFDIFVSAYKVYETDVITDYKLDAFLRGDILTGSVGTRRLTNNYTYPSTFVNPTIPAGQVISSPKVDSSSASRLAIEKYEVVDKFHPELYNDHSNSVDLIIYQGGTYNPSYDASQDVYSFGGIIENSTNLALYEYNEINRSNYSVPDWALERGKKELEINEQNSQIIDSSIQTEEIGVDKMMKLSFYFWFEGWDADCYNVINKQPVSINLNFSTSYRD